MSWRLWIVVGLLSVLGILVLQNTRVVEVRLLFWKLEMSRALLLFAVLGIGLVVGWLLGTLHRRS